LLQTKEQEVLVSFSTAQLVEWTLPYHHDLRHDSSIHRMDYFLVGHQQTNQPTRLVLKPNLWT